MNGELKKINDKYEKNRLKSIVKNLKKDDDLNYFSLQKYLKDHFPKTDSSVSA